MWQFQLHGPFYALLSFIPHLYDNQRRFYAHFVTPSDYGHYDLKRHRLLKFLRCDACWLSGVTRTDRLRNGQIREETFTAESISDVNTHGRLRWFARVWRMPNENLIKIAFNEDFKGQRKRGSPRQRWIHQIRQDTRLPLLTAERYALDRTKWRGVTSKRTARGQ